MPSRTPHAASFGGSPDEVESQFFEALQKGDITQLMACWADEDEIACIHPGGPRLLGAQAIRSSFEALFEHRELRLNVDEVRRVQTMGGAAHTLVVRISIDLPDGPREAHLVLTHAYQKTAQGWRLVVHHASAAPAPTESASGMSAGSGSPYLLH